jgi:hypothetical protein
MQIEKVEKVPSQKELVESINVLDSFIEAIESGTFPGSKTKAVANVIHFFQTEKAREQGRLEALVPPPTWKEKPVTAAEVTGKVPANA